MPDWSYRTLFRPLLFRLPPARARDATLRATAAFAALAGRANAIEWFGDMRPPAAAQQSVCGVARRSPVGLGAGLDVHTIAPRALAQCGFGFLELGPVTLAPVAAGRIDRARADDAITCAEPLANDGVDALLARLARGRPPSVPLGVRLAHRPGATPEEAALECGSLAARLAPVASFFTFDTRAGLTAGWSPRAWEGFLRNAAASVTRAAPDCPLMLCLPPDCPEPLADYLLMTGYDCGVRGVVVAGGIAQPDGTRLMGPPTFTDSLRFVRAIHAQWGERLQIIGSGGIREPADAVAMLAAGATCVQLHSGLVYSGPGLAKRINETVAEAREPVPHSPPRREPRFPFGWPWIALLGLGILMAGVLAWLVAATRVILPYDEQFLGLTSDQLAATNELVPTFMTHDRITFAGAMISLGVMYIQLALVAMRRGARWAWRAVTLSCGLGFAGFFLYLGFDYLDPLHAVSTCFLFILFLLGLPDRGPTMPLPPVSLPDLHNDARWRRGLVGQLLFALIGFGFIVGGLTIAVVGVTTFFVPTDLTFMHTTRDTLAGVNPRLIPLLAHDRASFGGTLLANGVVWLLAAMWGFRRGARWLWWAFLASGLPGFLTALGVHLAVGYTDFEHLAPVYLALALFALALGFSHPYLCAPAAPAPTLDAATIAAAHHPTPANSLTTADD